MEKTAAELNTSFFNRLAPIYDMKTSVGWRSPDAVAKKLMGRVRPDTVILDFGVGTGQLLSSLGIDDSHSSVFAVDVAGAMIDMARKKFPRVQYRQLDSLSEIGDLGWPNFEYIISSGVFEYIENVQDLTCALANLLSREGELVFTYQPIISYHPVQGEKSIDVKWSSESSENRGVDLEDVFHVREFMRHPHEMEHYCRKAGLALIEHESFVAYYDRDKLGNAVPKIYNLVRARSSVPQKKP